MISYDRERKNYHKNYHNWLAEVILKKENTVKSMDYKDF